MGSVQLKEGDMTLRDLPLWQQRLFLIVFGPVLLLIALASALCEGWGEFWAELRNAARDVRDIWNGE